MLRCRLHGGRTERSSGEREFARADLPRQTPGPGACSKPLNNWPDRGPAINEACGSWRARKRRIGFLTTEGDPSGILKPHIDATVERMAGTVERCW